MRVEVGGMGHVVISGHVGWGGDGGGDEGKWGWDR